MTCEKFESVMGYHCSPVLMGMKPANLVSFSKEKMPELPEIISDYEESLEREGIRKNRTAHNQDLENGRISPYHRSHYSAHRNHKDETGSPHGYPHARSAEVIPPWI